MNLDWNAIRALDGSQATGFEELCAQLARAVTPSNAIFVRKGTPDAGVECFCQLQNGSEWGWQAKYFTASLTGTQWRQLDLSVKSALEKHPALSRYFVCIPLDRADARIKNKESTFQKWEAHVSKWKCWAQRNLMNVEFEWWGSSELIQLLSQPEHIGRFYFWFNKRYFDEDWFKDRLNEAHSAAGPRYAPEINVDLPISQDFELFGRTDSGFDQVKSLARDIRRAFERVQYVFPDDEESYQACDLVELSQSMHLDELLQSKESVLNAFSALELVPDGVILLAKVITEIEAAKSLVGKALSGLHSTALESVLRKRDNPRSPYSANPLNQLRGSVFSLENQLSSAQYRLSQARDIVNSQLMILSGMAGTGKTHLLCDVARERIEVKAPTVLLLGQRFTSSEDPWMQIIQQLDMHDATAEEFIGALEAAAQARNSRALLIVDALNEGLGHNIWPVHLAAFLKRLMKSPWIGIVLSVRTTYVEFIIPEQIREQAIGVTHPGFSDVEYNAVQTYFSHYGLELPSAPILQPEFSNPLFLKVICEGIRGRNETKFTKGLHGITEVFEFYLDSVNRRLAVSLNYDPNDTLVQDALIGVAQVIAEADSRSLPRGDAQSIVNKLLPNREYKETLYRGLVTEGLLLEDTDWMNTRTGAKVTSIAYERFADYVVADFLIQTHLNADCPKSAFVEGGGLAFLCDEDVYTRPGLLEAMSVRVPERTGFELLRLVSPASKQSDLGSALRQSIVWRKLDSLSEETRACLNETVTCESDSYELLDVVLTVAIVEDHPFNAESLDRNLRSYSMPERDEWWSTYLHHAYQTNSAVDRLVDWALDLKPNSDLEDKTIDLCATTLAWMLTTSNRFLRDRATKALVSLLAERLNAMVRLVERFSNVDDLYVRERVFAVAYGVAMRSHDAKAVGRLASVVYERIFAAGTPPPHILLRDYARGVIERALHLGCDLQVDEQAMRPPYKSDWPTIPDEEAVEKLKPDYDRGSHDSGELEWARHRIYSSVMHDDFARYVIGTNFKQTNWLSLRLDEDPWQSPEDRKEVWLSKLSDKELKAWKEYQEKKSKQPIYVNFGSDVNNEKNLILVPNDGGPLRLEAGSLTEKDKHSLEQAHMGLENALQRLLVTLTAELRAELETIWQAESEDKPYFDLSRVQRYILCRVIELGWTVERFGQFDLHSIRDRGRDAAKPERIDKKYQWIAYHDILAYIADHYQYRGRYGEDDSDRAYEGPWQENFRDIDPSCTLERTPGDPSWGSHNPSWWANYDCVDWGEELGHEAWIEREGDFPAVEELLSAVRPDGGIRWINAKAFLLWRQSHPADLEPDMIDRRKMWLRLTAFFLPLEYAEAFMQWASCADTWGTWLHEPSGVQDFYLGELGWSQAFRHIFKPFYGYTDWEEPGGGCPTSVRPACFLYTAESGNSDCSIEDSFSLRLPHHDFVAKLGLRWLGTGTDFCDQHGSRIAYDPTVHEDGPSALLLREDCVRRYLTQNDLALVWIVQGEKLVLGKGLDSVRHGLLNVTGAFLYTDGKPNGSFRHRFDAPREIHKRTSE